MTQSYTASRRSRAPRGFGGGIGDKSNGEAQIGGGSPSWPVEQDSPSGVPLPNDGLEDGGAGGWR
jgi:hypothetical protein